jgi:hypothetical protein
MDRFMTQPRLLRWTVLVSTLLLLTACSGETATIRYKATATVSVDGQVYRGFSVRETSITATPNSVTGFALGVRDIGEGIMVDLGSSRNAIYVLRNDKTGSAEFPYLTMRCFEEPDSAGTDEFVAKLAAAPIGKTCKLTPSQHKTIMPLVVAFRDETVPKSIYEVTKPGFSNSLGDVRLVSIELERVVADMPLTRTINPRLPWLNQVPFDGSNIRVLDPHFSPNLAATKQTLANSATDLYFENWGR